jgi:sugar O-acyltransferase (sialic acid O-acetyltransferase NeuD family)
MTEILGRGKAERSLGIYGAGGHGREVAWLQRLIETHAPGTGAAELVFLDDRPELHRTSVAGIPVRPLEDFLAHCDERGSAPEVVIAIGSGVTRERIARRVTNAGRFTFANVIHPSALEGDRVVFGRGVVIARASTLTVDITIGDHVHVNVNCTISHDTVLEDYVTLSPGVHLSGAVHVGERSFFGTGAVVINGAADRPLRIGHDCVIGAGAVVTSDIPDGKTAVGVPARCVR